jgi:DNA repair protein RadC
MQDQAFTLSEIELRYNPKVPVIQKPRITTSKDAFIQFLSLFDENKMNIQEQAAVLFLNRGNRVIGGYKVSIGGISSTVFDMRITLASALKCRACGLIVAHTHPSGVLNPSKSDKDFTSRLFEAAAFHDIKLFDHLIILGDYYFSFADEGLV